PHRAGDRGRAVQELRRGRWPSPDLQGQGQPDRGYGSAAGGGPGGDPGGRGGGQREKTLRSQNCWARAVTAHAGFLGPRACLVHHPRRRRDTSTVAVEAALSKRRTFTV